MISYFDIHSHILPGIDDGAADMEEALKMLQIAYDEGIRVIVATPHYVTGGRNTSSDRLQELLVEVNRAYAGSCNEIQLIMGNELMYSQDLIDALKSGEALTIDGTRYILLEFMQDAQFREIREGLNNCIYSGYIPILAHAERYRSLIKDPLLVEELIRLGTYIQITFSSLTSGFTDPKENYCHKLLKKDMVHFLGTDAHGAYVRAPYIRKAVDILRKKYGESTVKRLLWDNPLTMLEDKHL